MLTVGNKRRTWRWRVMWVGLAVAALLALMAGAALYLAGHLEPLLRDRTVEYLRKRFDGEVDLGRFDVSMPVRDPIRVLLEKGKGAHVRVRIDKIAVRHRGRRDIAPLLLMDHLEFRLELSTLWANPVLVDYVKLAKLELTIPPKAERPNLAGLMAPETERAPGAGQHDASEKGGTEPVFATPVLIDHVDLDGMKLVVLPANAEKEPLEFQMKTLRLESAGRGVPMRYRTVMTNARPPGLVQCSGTFGPFMEREPGETPVTGNYTFTGADLGVFEPIAGTLSSTGSFRGRLNWIVVDGRAVVPDFQLKSARNKVPLKTEFHAIVDGTDGDTYLQQVQAMLGDSNLLCRGHVARNRDEARKTIDLDVSVTEGRIEDFISLATPGTQPPLKGGARLKFRMRVPPGPGEVLSRLGLEGSFYLDDASFTSTTVQERIDDISRRTQGKPSAAEINQVAAVFEGDFKLKGGLLNMSRLTFAIPGSDVVLHGWYDLASEQMDFRGVVRTTARVSQMMKSRWKRIVLKPVDPFFAKNGAGAVIRIAITGTRGNPSFGRDRQKGGSKAAPPSAGAGSGTRIR